MKTYYKRITAVLLVLVLVLLNGCAAKKETIPHLPVLLYHHITEADDGNGSVTVQQLEAQMAMLKVQGYQPISLAELLNFAEKGAKLPENPVVITFDDGYYSNYQYAYPILKKYQYPATIFAIGSSIGKSNYKDTAYSITPHFGEAEIREMAESGWISIQSHTYDMHQWPPYESGEEIRESVLPLPGETEEEYTAILTADHQKAVDALQKSGADTTVAVAFPHGETNPLATQILHENGVRITFTTDETKANTVTAKEPETLLDLGRMTIEYDTSNAKILQYLKKA